ncbi:MAG: MATE family efflux transporter [Natronomonas sp.]
MQRIGATLERIGVIEQHRLRSVTDLAWPRVVTGFAIMSKQAVDLAFVGVAVGATAVAGLAFAHAFWVLGKFVAIGLAGGTVALVSQQYGAENDRRASLVVKQSVVLALLISIPVTAVFVLFAEPLIALVGSDAGAEAVGHGTLYLAIAAFGIPFEFLNMVASRTYAGVGDTLTPMVIRSAGAALNVVISAVLIFGFGMGVAGAAVGTVVALAFVTVTIAWGMAGRTYLGRGASPVPLRRGRPYFDLSLARDLASISTPLVGRRLAEGIVTFPLLAIAATFGPAVVAAYAAARRIRMLIDCPSWGFSIAASTLVGQRLGAGDEEEATAYGLSIIRLSVVVSIVTTLVVFVFARPIASPFVGSGELDAATTFVRVAAASAVALAVKASTTGALRGAGDTRIPFYAALLGLYVFALPSAALGTVTAIGVVGLYVALLFEAVVPAVVTLWRFLSGRWRAVSRQYRPTPDAGD